MEWKGAGGLRLPRNTRNRFEYALQEALDDIAISPRPHSLGIATPRSGGYNFNNGRQTSWRPMGIALKSSLEPSQMESEALIAQYQIEPFRGSYEKLRNSAVMFTGSPRTSNSQDRILLLNDPCSQHSFFYEFRTTDVLYAEEAANLSLPDGSTAARVRLWIRKGATALKIEPFHVQDTASSLHDFLAE